MLKKIIVGRGAIIGAVIGFISPGLFLFLVALSYVAKDPSILTGEVWDLAVNLLTHSLYLGIIAGLIGALTGTAFGLIFIRFRTNKRLYILFSMLLCILIAVSENLLCWVISNHLLEWFLEYIQRSDFMFYIAFIPDVIYLVVGFFVNLYLFLDFEILALEFDVLAEENNISSAN